MSRVHLFRLTPSRLSLTLYRNITESHCLVLCRVRLLKLTPSRLSWICREMLSKVIALYESSSSSEAHTKSTFFNSAEKYYRKSFLCVSRVRLLKLTPSRLSWNCREMLSKFISLYESSSFSEAQTKSTFLNLQRNITESHFLVWVEFVFWGSHQVDFPECVEKYYRKSFPCMSRVRLLRLTPSWLSWMRREILPKVISLYESSSSSEAHTKSTFLYLYRNIFLKGCSL